MLTREENEFLTRVGAGTPMGNLLREFWFPILPSAEAPPRGGRPLRMKLLGEQLLLYRASNNDIGLISEFCPHRGASLFYARFEDDGVRCVYHGWKFAGDGRCVDMPNEAKGDKLKNAVKQTSYPCKDINGIIWTYMGPREAPPPFPNYGLAAIPADQKYLKLTVRECNWVQALEGDLDLSHGAYLHSSIDKKFLSQNHLDRFTGEKPRVEAAVTDYGSMHAVRRSYGPDNYHWGVAQFLFPFITSVPPVGDRMNIILGHVWIPIDDHSTLVMFYMWNPSGKVDASALAAMVDLTLFDPQWEEYLPATAEAMSQWRCKASAENNFGFDEEAQNTKRFSGLPTVDLQDHALQVGMGPIVNRELEHLVATDIPVVRMRRRLMEAAKKLQEDGTAPDCVDNPNAFSVRPASGVLPRETPWAEGTRDWISDTDLGKPVVAKGHLPFDEISKLRVPPA